MQTIPENLSSAGRAQLQAQLDLFSSIAIATVENTGRLALWQFEAGRVVLDRSRAAWSQVLSADPARLFEVMTKTQSGLLDMFGTARAPSATPAQPKAGDQPPATDPAMRTRAADGVTNRGDEQSGSGPQQHEQQRTASEVPEDLHLAQPSAPRTPIAEAAAQVVPDGQSAMSLAAAPTRKDGPVDMPRVTPSEGAPRAHGDDPATRRGAPRK